MRDRVIGISAGLFAVAIWASWIVYTRISVDAGLSGGGEPPFTPIDVALLRNIAPAILLAPFWLRRDLRESVAPRVAPTWTLVAINCWGAPFLALMALGLARSDAALGGALAPGLMPLLAAMLGFIFFNERPGPRRKIGLPLIAIGASITVANRLFEGGSAADSLDGAPFIVCASLMWACYATGFPRSGLTPVRATGLIGFWSSLLAGTAMLLGGESHMMAVDWSTLATGLFVHGVLSGAASVAAFSLAITKIGVGPASALAALVPGIAATLGALLLGDRLSHGDILGLVVASIGVLIVNLGGARRAADPAAAGKSA